MAANANALCARLVSAKPNLAVPWFILASYAYYQQDDPIISDDMFDWLVVMLKHYWPNLTHPHRDRITLEDLETGSGNALRYPGGMEEKLRYVRADALQAA